MAVKGELGITLGVTLRVKFGIVVAEVVVKISDDRSMVVGILSAGSD